VCNLIIDKNSYENIVSTALVDYLKLETERHPHSYTIGWIKKGHCIKVTNLYHVLISISKFYQDSVTCDAVGMDVIGENRARKVYVLKSRVKSACFGFLDTSVIA